MGIYDYKCSECAGGCSSYNSKSCEQCDERTCDACFEGAHGDCGKCDECDNFEEGGDPCTDKCDECGWLFCLVCYEEHSPDSCKINVDAVAECAARHAEAARVKALELANPERAVAIRLNRKRAYEPVLAEEPVCKAPFGSDKRLLALLASTSE